MIFGRGRKGLASLNYVEFCPVILSTMNGIRAAKKAPLRRANDM